ncbi:MAG: cyanophycin synthetase [Halanaerobium sp.]|nr:cyanophycin synthetase [Halanaerobium sp.]
MELREIRALKGANYYSHHPVLRVEIDLGRYNGVESNKLGDFNQRLLAKFPSLQEHYCSLGRPGGFVERLKKGTYLGHVLEHLILELEGLMGYNVFYGCTRSTRERGRYYVVVEYIEEDVARFLVKKGFQAVANLARNKDCQEAGEILAEAREIRDARGQGPSTLAILKEASLLDIPVMAISEEDGYFQLGYGKFQEKVQTTITSKTSCIGVDLACDKWRTKTLLQQFEIPVPKGIIVSSLEELAGAVEEISPPLVIKPFNANQGKGVSSSLVKEEEITRAYRIAREYSDRVIVEESLPGYDYRLLVIGDKLVAASKRVPPYVIGDGKNTIRELIAAENRNPGRGEGHEKPLTRIRIDSVVLLELFRQNLKMEDIIPAGKKVFLRRNGNLSTGGLPIDVTDLVHRENARLAVKVARILGLDLAGVDIITPDISQPLQANGGGIIEVNAAPGIRMHLFPYQGKERNVAREVVKYLFPSGKPARIPIIAVTGTNGKTTVARLVNHFLLRMGLRVGLCSTDGVYIGRRRAIAGDTTGYYSCQRVLMDPEVEVAVLETARGGILKNGLGFDYCDVGVITNIREDHLGQGEIETLDDLAHLKSLLVERCRKDGYAVLNAEDRYAGYCMKRARGKVLLCSSNPDNILVWKHLSDGGEAVVADKGILKLLGEGEERVIIDLADVPLTEGGRVDYQTENILLATGAALAANIPDEIIIDGLKDFGLDYQDNPGRFCQIDIEGRTVIIDYGHNPDGISRVLQRVYQEKKGQLAGVICSPGDRRDEDIKKIGWLAGQYLDRIIIKEDCDLRGRERGQVAAIIEEGVRATGFAGPIKIIYDELEAVRAGLQDLEERDTLVVFYEKDFSALYQMVNDYQGFRKPLLATRLT